MWSLFAHEISHPFQWHVRHRFWVDLRPMWLDRESSEKESTGRRGGRERRGQLPITSPPPPCSLSLTRCRDAGRALPGLWLPSCSQPIGSKLIGMTQPGTARSGADWRGRRGGPWAATTDEESESGEIERERERRQARRNGEGEGRERRRAKRGGRRGLWGVGRWVVWVGSTTPGRSEDRARWCGVCCGVGGEGRKASGREKRKRGREGEREGPADLVGGEEAARPQRQGGPPPPWQNGQPSRPDRRPAAEPHDAQRGPSADESTSERTSGRT